MYDEPKRRYERAVPGCIYVSRHCFIASCIGKMKIGRFDLGALG